MPERPATFRFSSPPADVDSVHDFLETVWVDHPDIDEMDKMAFETALIELASNVFQHADTGSGVTCVLSVRADDDRLQADLSDTSEIGGVTFVRAELPDDMAESGRGLAFIQMLVDDLRYERVEGRNIWSISKNRQPTGA